MIFPDWVGDSFIAHPRLWGACIGTVVSIIYILIPVQRKGKR